MRRLEALTVALGSIALVGGCASGEPTFGERRQAEGAGLAAIGEQWTEGQDKLERGEELIEEGNDLVEEGRRLIEDSEERYEARAGSS